MRSQFQCLVLLCALAAAAARHQTVGAEGNDGADPSDLHHDSRSLLQGGTVPGASACKPEAVDARLSVPSCADDAEADFFYPILCWGGCKPGYYKVWDIDGRCRCMPRCPDGWQWWASTTTGGVICRGCKSGFRLNPADGRCYANCGPPLHPYGYSQGYINPPLCCMPCPRGTIPSPSNPSLCMSIISPNPDSDIDIINIRNPLMMTRIPVLPIGYVWRKCVRRFVTSSVTITLTPYPCPRLWATCTDSTVKPDPNSLP